MKLTSRTLLVVITDESLEREVCNEIGAAGATGFTVTACHGRGRHSSHMDALEGGSVKIETVLGEEIAHQLLEKLANRFIDKRSFICYLQPVQVIRQDRF